MFLKKVEIQGYKALEHISFSFEKNNSHKVYPIISINGGGKSTLLQFIFTFLHCPFEANRHKYLMNILEHYKDRNWEDSLNLIARFELEYENESVHIEFIRSSKEYKELLFDSILEVRQLNEQRKVNEKCIDDINLLKRLEADISQSNLSPSIAARELKKISEKYGISFENTRSTFSINTQIVSNINILKKEILSLITNDNDLKVALSNAELNKAKLELELEKENLNYIFHFNSHKDVLLVKSNSSLETLLSVSNKVYLATPNSQVLHFFSSDQLKPLFSKEKLIYSSYESNINECQKDLTGLFTYDFSTISLINEAFLKAKDDDFKTAVETGNYGNQINQIKTEFNELLLDKSITIQMNHKNIEVGFVRTSSNIELTPKDLSHGELKRLSIYIWLKSRAEIDSVILMDEVDMGLHPTWQHELCGDLQKWSVGSQFMLATHSPQIISQAFYKNLVVLNPTQYGTIPEQFSEPPLESDLNTIVKTIMGGEYIPKQLTSLRKQYRSFFDNNNLDCEEAMVVKKQILEYESENSSFFQEIKFESDLLR